MPFSKTATWFTPPTLMVSKTMYQYSKIKQFLQAETCSSSSKNPTNVLPLKVETGNVKDLTKAVPQNYKVGFGPKKLSLHALKKLSEERSTQK